jgi:polysaccharide pyruvyl transferase WcaK-like protein
MIFSNYTENLATFSKYPRYNKYIFKILNEQPNLVDWKYQGDFECVIDGGGGIYFGHTHGKWYHAVINFLLRKIGVVNVSNLDVALRKIFRKPKHITFNKRIGVGLGIGEYVLSSPQTYSQFSDIGSYDFLFVRDAESKRLLLEYGFKRKVQVYTDIAFYSEYWLPRTRIGQSSIKSLAIILLDFSRHKKMNFDIITDFEKQAFSCGYKVTYYSIDDVMDVDYRESFKDRNLICWKPNEMSLDEFLNSLAQHTVVISARAHGVILGACLGLVPIIIPHSQKLVQISRMFPEASASYKITAFNDLMKVVDHIFLNLESCQRAVKLDVEMNKNKAKEMLESFVKVL